MFTVRISGKNVITLMRIFLKDNLRDNSLCSYITTSTKNAEHNFLSLPIITKLECSFFCAIRWSIILTYKPNCLEKYLSDESKSCILTRYTYL
jgi:hypothetical protein